VWSVYLIVCVVGSSKRGYRATEHNLAVFTQLQKVNAVWHYVSQLRGSSRVCSSFIRDSGNVPSTR
jgi:hypothetical protein